MGLAKKMSKILTLSAQSLSRLSQSPVAPQPEMEAEAGGSPVSDVDASPVLRDRDELQEHHDAALARLVQQELNAGVRRSRSPRESPSRGRPSSGRSSGEDSADDSLGDDVG
jgi:hypothetical protein